MINISQKFTLMSTKRTLLSLAIAVSVCSNVYARENIGSKHGSTKQALATGCAVDAGAAYMEINNIRARIMDEGDMWWDPGAGLPRYYAPAGGKASSLFAGALWVGGVDAGGQLKVAAMTYRQNGEDFWTGPIYSGFQISATQCQQWDKLFYVTRAEVDLWAANPTNPVPTDIANWPGNDPSDGSMLAPYHAGTGNNGSYNPQPGAVGAVDYPGYDLAGTATSYAGQIFGDATLWWVINDIGNTHTESGGVAIGLEVREQCFAFQTNDAVNNMTFLNYEIINKSTYQVNNTYFGAWVDPDLGNGGDDFVGCDVGRSMGYCYNGECDDPDGAGNFAGEIGYHSDPPAIGAVFFQGPKEDSLAHHCYDKVVDGVTEIGMAKFVYYNNDFTVQGNPTKASDYYNYLRGMWQDGSSMTYGGNGYQTSSVPTNYMFDWTPPGACSSSAVNTDPTGCGTNGVVQNTEWDEGPTSAKDVPGDRRFMQSAGPFTLAPGAVNYITVGMVWDQPSTPNECNVPPICLIQQDADLAQALFNNHFKVLDGPDAPDLNIQELNQELVITISNKKTSNNYLESYSQVSPTIIGFADKTFKFQGYQIFQVVDSAISGTQLGDNTVSRLVAECDIKDGVGVIYNWVKDQTTGKLKAIIPNGVAGQDNGISHSFDIKADQFQEDNITTLVNDRPYYYVAIAYAYNNYETYDPTTAPGGQQTPFLQGRRNIKVYHAYPHIPSAESYGTIQNSDYGSGPEITRLGGHGNSTNVLQMDPASENYIITHDTMANPSYMPGHGPIDVKVVDPLSVIDANFVLTIHPATGSKAINGSSWWELDDLTRGWKFYSDVTIGTTNEQILPQYGISITITNIPYPSGKYDGVIDSACSLTFADNTKQWLGSVPTAGPGTNPLFWIRSGTNIDRNCADNSAFNSYPVAIAGPCPSQTQTYFFDANQWYNQILGGSMAPFALCAQSDPGLYCDNGPGFACMDSIANIASVDIVITSDMSKWTRCIVFEEQDETALSEGGAKKMDMRKAQSVDKFGNPAPIGSSSYSSDPNAPNYISNRGMGWFPGYTINIETGERLNMAFGEDSWLAAHNGRDMKWNPDSVVVVADASGGSGASQIFGISSVFGGKHYIYVFAHNNNQANKKYNIPFYDKDSTAYNILTTITPATLAKSNVLGDIMWAGIPLLKQGHSLLECDATIHLRVAKPYDTNYGSSTVNSKIMGSTWNNPTNPNGNLPTYGFSTNGIAVDTMNTGAAKSALNLINIVPNPYYAYSSYENNRLDNRVRITNLPPVCTISIFSLNGTLIDVINKNDPSTFIDWNLENQYNIPISSGMYIIHIAVPNVGQVTLKWFGVMRPTDLNSY